MKNRVSTVGLLAMCAMTLTSCALTATMVPVAGPLSEQRPVPVVQVRADGILGNSGKIKFVVPSGDRCEGRWSSAAGQDLTIAGGSLLSQYGSTYLTGYALSTGRGQNPGRALAVCTSGRVVDLEFVTGAGTAHGFGIGKDNQNNVFRFVF